MTDQQWQLAWSLYQQISDADKPSPMSFSQSLTGDPEVLAQVRMLLRSTHYDSGHPRSPLPAALQPGDQVGRFVIRELVGAGSFGQVYAARDLELNRSVALKVLHRTGEYSNSRSFREARAASALNHPGIVTIYDVVQTDACFAIAMELVEGESLRKRLARPLSGSEVCLLGAQIARALAVSHAAGIIHGDLKPENIMLRQDGYVKLLDFGLAQDLENDAGTAHLLAGTLSYMAPELFAGRVTSSASDCFALGVLLAEMTAAAQSDSARSPHSLQALTRSLLADDPARRPPANEVAEKLDQIDLPLIQSKRHTRRLVWGTAVAALAALVAFWTTHHRLETPRLAAPPEVKLQQSPPADHQMNAAAYNLSLQAHYAEQQHTPELTQKAIQLFREASRVDPTSGALHASLAGAYLLTLEYGSLPTEKAQQMAEVQAQIALRLGSHGAHTILAELREARGDWTGAAAEFKLAPRPNPIYSLMLSQIGRPDEALIELEQVRKKQPWALDYMAQVGTILYLARRYEPALAQEKNVLVIEPRFYGAAAWLTEIFLATHRPKEALAVFNRYLKPVENTSYFEAIHVYAYAASGDLANAQRLLAIMSAPQKGTYVAPGDLATAYIGVHDFTKAAEYLDKAYALHDSQLEYLKADPLYDPMRSDPRFQKILAKMNFPR